LESNEGHFNSAHHNLTEVRKKYDEMKKERVVIEEKIDKQKVSKYLFRKKLGSCLFLNLNMKKK